MDVKEQNVFLKQQESDVKTKPNGLFRRLLSQMTLEPMWFGVGISFMISVIAFKNLFLQRACLVDLGYSEEECFHSVGAQKLAIELESQRLVSSTMVGSGTISGLLTLVAIMFLAPWTDCSGRRKSLMILSLSGSACGTIGLLIMTYLPHLSVAWVIYAHAIPLAIGGYLSTLSIAANSYLGDICYKTGRCTLTVMGTNNGFFVLFMTLGTIAGPIIYRTMGFVGLFAVCFVLEISSLLYVIFFIEDVYVAEKIPSVMDIRLPWKALKCAFKKRKFHRRMNVILCILIPCCNSLMYVAEVSLSYMYLRNRFSWTEVEYSALLTIKSVTTVLGTFIIVTFFKNKCNMEDKTIGIIGGISHILGSLAMILSYSPNLIFLTSIVGIFIRGAGIAERPILNKQIVANEQGKISSVTASLEKLFSFITLPFCNYLYSVTLEWFPGCFLLICVFASAIQIICYALVRPESTNVDEIEDKEENLD